MRPDARMRFVRNFLRAEAAKGVALAGTSAYARRHQHSRAAARDEREFGGS